MTLGLKSFLVMSHPLPQPVLDLLTPLARGLDEGLQAEGHHVDTGIAVHPAFDQSYVDANLTRAMVCSIVRSLDLPGLSVEILPLGGCEVRSFHEGVERLFRLRRARRDADGYLDVRVSSDSILTTKVNPPTLFGPDATELFEPETENEQWVLPYLISGSTRTLIEMSAALPIGTRNEHSPFRLILDQIVRVPHTPVSPPSFPTTEEDLDIPEETEGTGESDGEAAA